MPKAVMATFLEGTKLTLHYETVELPPHLRELLEYGTINRVIIFRRNGAIVDTSIIDGPEIKQCTRTLHAKGGVHHCILQEGHGGGGHLFDLPECDTRIAGDE